MCNLLLINAFCLFFITFSSFALSQENSECGACNRNSCDPPRNCQAGLVKDSCECCYLCGKREGERCQHESLPSSSKSGRCGDNLECRVRSDLNWDDPPEAVCICTRQNVLCGSDGVTYENICQLTEARYSKRNGLRAISSEPCIKPPRIVSPPLDIRNSSGSYAVLTCEARGWPIPTIQWELDRGDDPVRLPGNNSRLSIQSQIGPNADEITSWLLFLQLSEEDEGHYLCRAVNDLGSESKSATVYLV